MTRIKLIFLFCFICVLRVFLCFEENECIHWIWHFITVFGKKNVYLIKWRRSPKISFPDFRFVQLTQVPAVRTHSQDWKSRDSTLGTRNKQKRISEKLTSIFPVGFFKLLGSFNSGRKIGKKTIKIVLANHALFVYILFVATRKPFSS